MPKFSYMARDASGAALSGELVARSQMDAVRLLRAEGKFVVKLQEVQEALQQALQISKSGGRSRVKPDELVYFINQLASMIDAGVPIADALEAGIDGAPAGAFRRTIEDVIARVQSGTDFSAALAAHPRVFPPLLVHMVRASETTGTLGAMLTRVAEYLVNQREITKKIKGALIYPACMLTFAIGATVFLIMFVLPKFTNIYAGKKAVLPLPTLILMNTSDWMVSHWLWLLIGAVLTVTGAILYFRSDRGRITADWLRLNAPLLSGMFRKAYLARTLRTLGSMISAGVSVLDAVMITRDVVGNRIFGRGLEDAHQRLQQGEQLTAALHNAPYWPRPIWQMLHAGEKTGQLGTVMDRAADFCEAELSHRIRSLTQFIEPAMIIIMGAIIGTIAVAMLLPIFQISKVMTQ